ncbi:hypothetical protein FRB90_001115 [Tulasnella sp. 427]|nr:hypothetical protein FRB90_001115 [Tulasnella sp. 427]
MYNEWSGKQREEWPNRLICCKALFCLNAIRRTQGILAYRAKTAEKDSLGPLKLSEGISPFDAGTMATIQTIDSDRDMMWGWWLDENPTLGRSDAVKQGVECVKHALLCAAEVPADTPESLALRTSFHGMAIMVTGQLREKWGTAFPINVSEVRGAVFASHRPEPAAGGAGHEFEKERESDSRILPNRLPLDPGNSNPQVASVGASNYPTELTTYPKHPKIILKLPEVAEAGSSIVREPELNPHSQVREPSLLRYLDDAETICFKLESGTEAIDMDVDVVPPNSHPAPEASNSTLRQEPGNHLGLNTQLQALREILENALSSARDHIERGADPETKRRRFRTFVDGCQNMVPDNIESKVIGDLLPREALASLLDKFPEFRDDVKHLLPEASLSSAT